MMRWMLLLSCSLCGPLVWPSELFVEPYRANGWTEGLSVPEQTALPLKDEEKAGVCDLFSRVDALRVCVARRTRAYAFWLWLSEEEESTASDAPLRFELEWLGRRYPFDRWGCFAIDHRFVRPEDAELIARFEAFFRDRINESPLGQDRRTALQEKSRLSVAEVPVFAGFEDDRYQRHDALILRLTKAFNEDKAGWAGASKGEKVEIPELRPALVKAQMIEESGGNGPWSQMAWEKDPLQVNVPGDWSEAKADLGLSKPENRNEGTVEENLRAGIMYLVRKGFGVSGQPIARRPAAYFDSWGVALQRYNGRDESLSDGRSYRSAYADRILRRAWNPSLFVPIAIEHRSLFHE